MVEEIEYGAEKLIAQLKEKSLKISVAESCTGGMISSKLVGISGASQVFYEGVVTYSNESKVDRLKVSKETIEKYGVVSYKIAEEMVRGLTTEVGISTTGVAGPDGGTVKNPVGTVYVGVRYFDEIRVEKYFFQGTREEIREKATDKAIKLGLESIKYQEKIDVLEYRQN